MAKKKKNPRNGKHVLLTLMLIGIIIISSISFNSKEDSQENENITTSTTTTKVSTLTTTTTIAAPTYLLNRNYNVIATPADTFREMAFNAGEEYLRSIGFTIVEARNYAEDMRGYFASFKPYSNIGITDNVEIVIENDHILYSVITLVYLEKDLTVAHAYNDLKLLNSAFNGYTIPRTAVENVYNSVKINNNKATSNFNDEFISFNLTAEISIVNSQTVYTFKLEQQLNI